MRTVSLGVAGVFLVSGAITSGAVEHKALTVQAVSLAPIVQPISQAAAAAAAVIVTSPKITNVSFSKRPPVAQGGFFGRGCRGIQRRWLTPMSRDMLVVQPTVSIFDDHAVLMRVVMQTAYDRCYYGRDRIKLVWSSTCVTMLQGDPTPVIYKGVWVNEFAWTKYNGQSSNPRGYWIKDNGRRQRCSPRKYVDHDRVHWLHLNKPRPRQKERAAMHRAYIKVAYYGPGDYESDTQNFTFGRSVDLRLR